MVPALYTYAKLKFDCGLYEDAANLLDHYRYLSRDDDLKFRALWGKLAAEILMVNWDQAVMDLHKLKGAIDSRVHVLYDITDIAHTAHTHTKHTKHTKHTHMLSTHTKQTNQTKHSKHAHSARTLTLTLTHVCACILPS